MSVMSNATRVTRLYRHSLKTCLSWAVMRDVFYPERDRIRAMFEKNKSLRDPGAIERAIEDGEKTLDGYAHPDPYTVPSSYGGSKYARNPPPPGIEILYDFGRERGTTPGPDGHYR